MAISILQNAIRSTISRAVAHPHGWWGCAGNLIYAHTVQLFGHILIILITAAQRAVTLMLHQLSGFLELWTRQRVLQFRLQIVGGGFGRATVTTSRRANEIKFSRLSPLLWLFIFADCYGARSQGASIVAIIVVVIVGWVASICDYIRAGIAVRRSDTAANCCCFCAYFHIIIIGHGGGWWLGRLFCGCFKWRDTIIVIVVGFLLQWLLLRSELVVAICVILRCLISWRWAGKLWWLWGSRQAKSH